MAWALASKEQLLSFLPGLGLWAQPQVFPSVQQVWIIISSSSGLWFLPAIVSYCSWFLQLAYVGRQAAMGTWCLCAFPGRSVVLRLVVSLSAFCSSHSGFCTGICFANSGEDTPCWISSKETRKWRWGYFSSTQKWSSLQLGTGACGPRAWDNGAYAHYLKHSIVEMLIKGAVALLFCLPLLFPKGPLRTRPFHRSSLHQFTSLPALNWRQMPGNISAVRLNENI